jgi:hypothetical protein
MGGSTPLPKANYQTEEAFGFPCGTQAMPKSPFQIHGKVPFVGDDAIEQTSLINDDLTPLAVDYSGRNTAITVSDTKTATAAWHSLRRSDRLYPRFP